MHTEILEAGCYYFIVSGVEIRVNEKEKGERIQKGRTGSKNKKKGDQV